MNKTNKKNHVNPKTKNEEKTLIKNQKGFFSFFIVLAISLILLTTIIEYHNNNLLLTKTKDELIKNEQSHKEKTLLENNTDTIIETKLREQIILRNFNSTIIENAINTELYNYLKEKTKTYNTITKTQKTLSISYLNENSKAFAYEIDGIIYGEYSFTSDITKSATIRAEMGDETKQEFLIPPKYIVKKLIGADLIELN